jgi:hypothetical protein
MSEGRAMVTPTVFRQQHPAPPDLNKVIEAYQRANAILLTRAQTGLRAKVRVIDAKGQVVEGYDEYFSSAPAKLREVRGNSEIEGISVIAIAPGLHHTLVTLVVNEEGAPVSSTEVEWVNGQVLAQAHYEYLLDVAIEPLTLPKR